MVSPPVESELIVPQTLLCCTSILPWKGAVPFTSLIGVLTKIYRITMNILIYKKRISAEDFRVERSAIKYEVFSQTSIVDFHWVLNIQISIITYCTKLKVLMIFLNRVLKYRKTINNSAVFFSNLSMKE